MEPSDRRHRDQRVRLDVARRRGAAMPVVDGRAQGQMSRGDQIPWSGARSPTGVKSPTGLGKKSVSGALVHGARRGVMQRGQILWSTTAGKGEGRDLDQTDRLVLPRLPYP